MRDRTGRLRDLAAIFALVAGSLLLFVPWMVRGADFLGMSPASAPPWVAGDRHLAEREDASSSDALLITYPNLVHWARAFREDRGAILWNPLSGCGTPFLANQIAFPLYPTNFLFLAGGLPAFLLWAPLIHVALANVGAWCALRRLALGRVPCMLGAWAFGSGSWFLAHLDIINFPQAAAWMPWILYAADRAQVQRRTRDRLLLGGFLAISILAGMIQITLIAVLAAAILVRVRAEVEARRGGASVAWRGVGSVAAGLLLGVLLAGPQLLPLAEWSFDSTRVRRTASEQQPFAYRPVEWLHLLVPEILGSPAQISRWTRPESAGGYGLAPTDEASYPPAARAGVRGRGQTFTESVCSPLATGLLLGLLALARPRRHTLLFVGLVAAGALLAMDTPILRAVTGLPGGAFANPRRFLLVSAAGFAGLAAAGAHALGSVAARRRLVALVPAGLLLAWILMNLIGGGLVVRLLTGGADGGGAAVPAIFRDQAAAPFLIFLAGGIAAIGRTPSRWRMIVLAALAAGDALAFQLRNNPLRSPEPVFPETAATRFLAARAAEPLPTTGPSAVRCDEGPASATRFARFASAIPAIPPPMPPNSALLFGLRDQQAYGGVLPRRLEEVLEAAEPGIVFEHMAIAEWRDAASLSRPLLAFLGVRHVIAARHEIPGMVTLKQFPEERCAVFENPRARARVTALSRARVYDDLAPLLARLSGPGFDPATEVLLDGRDLRGSGVTPVPEGGVIDLPEGAPGDSVRWTQLGAAEARVRATLAAPRFLVVAEGFHPGWKAEDQNGRRLPLLPANHAFQAVFLPAGVTDARVFFDPWSSIAGIVLLGCGVLAALADTILRRRISPDS